MIDDRSVPSGRPDDELDLAGYPPEGEAPGVEASPDTSDPDTSDPDTGDPAASALAADSLDECRGVAARVYEFLDNELDQASYGQIQAHLEACEKCLDQYDVEVAMRQLVQRCCRTKAPATLRISIQTSIVRWRDESC